MQFSAVLATLLLASSAVSIALPQELDDSTAIAGNGTTVLEDGVEPAFDPQELTLDESTVQVEGRGLDEEKTLERRSPASSIVDCAKKLKGTKYLFGGCKSTSPFGPVKGGMDCSCLSRTCVKKGTGTTIRKYSPVLRSSEANKVQLEPPRPNIPPKQASAIKSTAAPPRPGILFSGVAVRVVVSIMLLLSLSLVISFMHHILAMLFVRRRSGRVGFARRLFGMLETVAM